jgi:hypothetical protein
MKSILIALTLLALTHSQEPIIWQKTSNWKLYKINDSVMFSISADSLNLFKNYQLQSDSIINFLDGVVTLPKVQGAAWMGGVVASCVYAGKVRKILISDYGGFFYDQESGNFFQLPAQVKDDWMRYINSCLSTL